MQFAWLQHLDVPIHRHQSMVSLKGTGHSQRLVVMSLLSQMLPVGRLLVLMTRGMEKWETAQPVGSISVMETLTKYVLLWGISPLNYWTIVTNISAQIFCCNTYIVYRWFVIFVSIWIITFCIECALNLAALFFMMKYTDSNLKHILG